MTFDPYDLSADEVTHFSAELKGQRRDERAFLAPKSVPVKNGVRTSRYNSTRPWVIAPRPV